MIFNHPSYVCSGSSLFKRNVWFIAPRWALVNKFVCVHVQEGAGLAWEAAAQPRQARRQQYRVHVIILFYQPVNSSEIRESIIF